MALQNLEEKKTDQGEGQSIDQEPKVGKVLVVDDDQEMARNVSQILKADQIDSDLAYGVEEALELLKTNQYVGLIVDGLNGKWPEVAQAALALGMKVKLFTATPFDARNHELITSSKVELLTKPDAVDQLSIGFSAATK